MYMYIHSSIPASHLFLISNYKLFLFKLNFTINLPLMFFLLSTVLSKQYSDLLSSLPPSSLPLLILTVDCNADPIHPLHQLTNL